MADTPSNQPFDPNAEPHQVPSTPDGVQPHAPHEAVEPEEDLLDALGAEPPQDDARVAPVADPEVGPNPAKPPRQAVDLPKPHDRMETPAGGIGASTTRLRREKPRQFRMLVVVVGIAVVALVLVAVVATHDNGRARTSIVDVHPTTETSSDVDVKFKTFMNEIGDKLPSLIKDMRETQLRVGSIEQRIDTTTKAMELSRANDSKLLNEKLDKFSRLLEARDPSHVTQIQAGDYDAFIQVLLAQKARSGLSLEEARLRIETWLKSNGFDPSGIAVMRDRGLDKLGFIYVGDIAEPPLSQEELDSLPEVMRGAVKALSDNNQQTGAFQGKVVYREEDSLKFLRHTLGDAVAKGLKLEDLKKGAFLARVRKENVTKEMEEVLPDLAAHRDERRIAPTDIFRIESFIYEQKAKRWAAMTPGQHLALTMSLAGMRANGGVDLSAKNHPATSGERDLLVSSAKEAVVFARGQGVQAQDQLIGRARNAVQARATDLKVALPPHDLEALVLTAVADVLRADQSPAAATVPDQAEGDQGAHSQREKPVSKGPDAPQVLRLGPLTLARDRAPAAAVFQALVIVDRLHIDPRSPDGAACLAAILAAAPSIGREAWDAVAGTDGNLHAFSTAVVGEFQELITKARPLSTIPVAVGNAPPRDAALIQAVELGRVLGAQRSAEKAVLDVALKHRLADLGHGAKVVLPADQTSPWARFLAIFSASGEALAGVRPERLVEDSGLIQKQLVERTIAHEQLALPGFSKDFRDKLVRDLDGDLVTSLPVIIALRDDGHIAPDLLAKLVIASQNRYTTAATAEAIASARGMQAIGERFASLFDNDSLIEPLYTALAAWIPDHVHSVLEASKPDITDTTISTVAIDTASALTDPMTQFIVKTIIANNIDPRIKASAGTLNLAGYQHAMELVRSKLDGMTIQPLTVKRVDELTIELHQQAMAALESSESGRRPGAVATRTGPGGQPQAGRPGFFDVKDEGLPGIPIGSRKEVVNSGQVFGIPRGSAMHVYLEIGADVPLKSSDGGSNDRVQFRSRGGFFDPTGHWYAFPSCILQGKVRPNPGGDRNMVELTHLVTVVHGITVEREISGLVTDEEDGINGMRARFDKHYEKVIVEAAELAVIEGIGQGLSSTRQTSTVVVPGSTTQSTNTGSSLQYGVGAGLQKGTDILVQYQQSYLDKLSPTMKTWNGQKLVAQFFSTVDFPEVSEKDWQAAAADGGSWNGF